MDENFILKYKKENCSIFSCLQVPVIDLSWSCVGYMLAIATGHLDHDSWCEHNSQIYVYMKKYVLKNIYFKLNLKKIQSMYVSLEVT